MGWDRGVDYEVMYKRLAKAVTKAEGVGRCYAAIALTQLRNGARISEAIDAFMAFILSGGEIVEVRVGKKRKEEYRVMKIPPVILESRVREECRELTIVHGKLLRDRVRWWLRKHFNVNTHSLRYSFITYALMRGLDFAVVARMVHHANPSLLQRYVQRRVADDLIMSDNFDPLM
ncbi:MAG: hypothetical protein N3D79_06460 [Acidilobaceae archaeon]|nr:hypothetical protein [Acidilobaceae archaeon]